MATSKILIDGVGIDLTSDTVSANRLEQGYTAHNSNGDIITGTLVPGITPTGTKTITANGTTDVTNYASANVEVPIIVNDNLLDNWYMGDPVNQRGQATYTGGRIYSIDRWLKEGSPITVAVQTDNILISTSSSDGYVVMQFLTNELQIGLPYTMSILYSCPATAQIRLSSSGTTMGYAELPSSTNKALVSKTYTFTSGNPVNRFEIRPGNNSNVTIYAIKLEQSDIQTLAHQENGEWVLDTIPNKTDEMHRCQTSTADINDNYANKILFPPNAITAGDTPVKFVAGYQFSTGSSLMEVSRITITRAGTYRFRWVANRGSSTGTYRTQLWKNGVAVSEEYTPSSTIWVGSYSVDVACSAGDYVCVYARGRSDSYPLGISGFTACINGDNGF